MSLLFIFLQNQSSGGTAVYGQLILIGGILIVFYFFMILPQQRKQKAQQQFREALKVGDEVVTIGGLHGKIHQIEANTIVLLVDKTTKLVFDKNAISVEATQRIKEVSASS
jgi:preprotein translocase subunit YajC